MSMRSCRFLASSVFVALLLTPVGPAAADSTILLLNLDGPGEGLNDPTPVFSEGGNPGLTMGEARLAAVQYAAAVWAGVLISDVPIRIGVSFDPLGGSENSTYLGLGGPADAFRDFAGAPMPGVWYPAALADKLAGLDLGGPGATDLDVMFNSDVDGFEVLASSHFYYGFDGDPPAGDVDFISIALHELGHGLGFSTFLDVETGAKLFGYDDAFLLQLERHGASPPDFPSMTDAQRVAATVATGEVHWTGAATVAQASVLSSGTGADGHVEMHAPNPPDLLSSLAHFSESLTPHELMAPFYAGPTLDLALTLAVLQDLGWGAAPQCVIQQVP